MLPMHMRKVKHTPSVSSITSDESPPLSVPAIRPPRLNRAERHARRERLKQHKWILDVEHERRFRGCMRQVVDRVLEFQDDHVCVKSGSLVSWMPGLTCHRHSTVSTGRTMAFKPNVNLDRVISL
jgi:hypothetical protein